ncbi:serine/threonine-protein kinase [Dokdonella soli]|uniref:Protein kinase domain-containing protein n=1 Tax=Dokdonella soli TaxID=529810 RepID=A0ABN1IDZ6_9GAMM
MDMQRWQRIGAIFDEMVETPAEARATLLDQRCGTDAKLRGEVEALLAADDVADRFDRGVNSARNSVVADWAENGDVHALRNGDRIGPWRLIEELGRGGMGVVWLAERADGQFEQRAALKLIKRGMDSEAVQARFLRERQILAHLEHPRIARLLDGGIAADGLPYFAMEYVKGLPLLRYAAGHELGLHERIALFLDICSAVQFAHRQLVVHLDLKPSNVLITTDGTVKLLDFGIAKLLGGETGSAIQTGDFRDRPLTPAYASPEQLSGAPVSTATDVYALGAILYELLTARRPHDLGDTPTLEEIRRLLESTAPPPPSKRAAVDGPMSARRLRGDLDTIVLTALKREPERRYPTVNALAEDLRSYLDGQPIAARRDNVVYRSGKFLRRHRLGVALASLALLGLFATTVVALWEAGRAREQARQAETVTGFLIDTFRVADPKGAPGGAKLSAVDVLDAGAQRLDAQLAGQPELGSRFAAVLGAIYQELGQYDRAIALLDRSLALKHTAPDDPARADILTQLARAQYEKGDYAAAEKNAGIALTTHRASTGASSAIVARDLALQGEIARRQGDFRKAEPLLQQALAMSRTNLKAPDAQIAADLNELAALYNDMHRLDEGTASTEEALAMFRTLYGENHLDVAENLINLGSFRMQTGHVAEALPPLEEATAIYRRLLPPDHPLLANALVVHANALDRLNRYQEAEPLYLDALATQRRLLGDHHPDVAATLNNLCVMYRHSDEFVRSADYCRQASAVWVALDKPEHPFALASKSNLSVALRESGDLVESERLIRQVLDARLRQSGAKTFLVPYTMDQLAVVLHVSGRSVEAVAQHQRAQALRKNAPGTPPLEVAAAQVDFALSELDVGDLPAANEQVGIALNALNAMKPVNSERLADAWVAEARIALAQHDTEAGCTAAKKALELRPPDDPKTGWRHSEALAVHGECLAARKEFTSARNELRSALADLQRVRGIDHWRTRPVRQALLALPAT